MPLKKRVIRPSSESTEHDRQLVSALFGRPKFELPDLPDDITSIDDEELMILFSQYVQWQNYVASDFAATEVAEERAEALVKRLEAAHMVVNWGAAKDKVTLARAQQAVDPAITQAKDELLDAYSLRKMTQVVYENCERCAFIVSRELSRRIGRDPRERRQNRWNP